MPNGFLAAVGEPLADDYLVRRAPSRKICADYSVCRLKMKQRAQK